MTAEERAKGSMNPEYAAECGGKLRHPHFLSAMLHAQRLEGLGDNNVVVYRCSYCGTDHVGHSKAKAVFPTFLEPSLRARYDRDKQLMAALANGTAPKARQGKPSVLTPLKISENSGQKPGSPGIL